MIVFAEFLVCLGVCFLLAIALNWKHIIAIVPEDDEE